MFHAVLEEFLDHAGRSGACETDSAFADQANLNLRGVFEESGSRLGLLSRLVTGMGAGAIAALALDHAGAAIFLTALSLSSGQARDLAVLSTNTRQPARLALALRAAGLKPVAVAEQLLYLDPELSLPEGFDQLRSDHAAAMLGASMAYQAD